MKELTEIITIQATYIYKDEETIERRLKEGFADKTKKNLEQKYSDADDLIINVQQFYQDSQKAFPLVDDEYWYISPSDWSIKSDLWYGDYDDIQRQMTNNIFRTEEEARVAEEAVLNLLKDLKDVD